jgi:hypothetical protein
LPHGLYQGLALVGDGQYDDLQSLKPGAVYPFFLNGADWVAADRIDYPGPPSDAPHFGFAVDVYGIFAVIGAYNEELPGPDQGANLAAGSAYVFRLQSGAWVYTGQALAAPIPLAGERFGNSVSVNAGRMAIGAPGAGPAGGGTSNGSVYLYELQQNGVWIPAGVLLPTDLEFEDTFGWSVSVETFVVGGAPNDQLSEAGPFTQEGSVYVAAFE